MFDEHYHQIKIKYRYNLQNKLMSKSQNDQPIVINNKKCKTYFVINGSKVYFNADFDSGNLQKVQQLSTYIYKLYPGYDKTRFTTDKTFFHFKVNGFKMCTVRFQITRQHMLQKFIKNSNDQQAYKPVYRIDDKPFEFLKSQIKIYRNYLDELELSFEYSFENQNWVQFAFSYPYSYEHNQNLIKQLKQKYQDHNQIYFHDQVLAYTQEYRNMYLITISEKINCNLEEREENIQNLFPENNKRPYKIDKPKILISGRVHPGQTPASFCIQGLLRFLLNQKDYRAYLLRKNFNFLIIPMLNPDGVYNGMFRVDMNGDNLNRFYQVCSKKKHPTIWSFRQLLKNITNVCFYFDFHGHPSKKGFFIYGNAFQQFIHQVQAQTFGKMIQSNCPYFQNLDCIFSEKQMSIKNPNEQHSKEGCGRVFVHKQFNNLIHSYTIQCGYFTPNKLQSYPLIDDKLISSGNYCYDYSYEYFSLKQYRPQAYFIMGKSILITILDLFHLNPYPRVILGQFRSIHNIRKAVALRIYHQAEKFRLIDANCYAKIKQIKDHAQQLYKQKFPDFEINIRQNYGMKHKKRTFSLNAKVYGFLQQKTKNSNRNQSEDKALIERQQQQQLQQVVIQEQFILSKYKIKQSEEQNKQIKYRTSFYKKKTIFQSLSQKNLIASKQSSRGHSLQPLRKLQTPVKNQKIEDNLNKKLQVLHHRRQSQQIDKSSRLGQFLKRQAIKQDKIFQTKRKKNNSLLPTINKGDIQQISSVSILATKQISKKKLK